LQVLDYKGNGGEGGIRTLGTGVACLTIYSTWDDVKITRYPGRGPGR